LNSAETFHAAHRYILRDLSSRAGTCINDCTITEHILGHGDQVRIGYHQERKASAATMIL